MKELEWQFDEIHNHFLQVCSMKEVVIVGEHFLFDCAFDHARAQLTIEREWDNAIMISN